MSRSTSHAGITFYSDYPHILAHMLGLYELLQTDTIVEPHVFAGVRAVVDELAHSEIDPEAATRDQVAELIELLERAVINLNEQISHIAV